MLAAGRAADVFDLGDGRVLRRYRGGFPAEREAAVMEHARAHGFPVPAVHDVDGPDMVLERVEGPTMLAELGRRPWALHAHASTLAALHRRLHEIAAPPWLPAPLGPGGALLHLDLHPGNVILARGGPVVIDWTNTRRGEGDADVAQTWLLLATSVLPRGGVQRIVVPAVRRRFLRLFLAHFDRAAVARVLPAVAEARLEDPNVLAGERTAIERLAQSGR